MQTKNRMIRFILLIPTSFFMLNLACAQADYTDTPSEQVEYYDNMDAPSQMPNDSDSDSNADNMPSPDSNDAEDETNDAPQDNSDNYDDE